MGQIHDWVASMIALGVAIIGYMQWHTANQKVVVDLYDRRLKVFSEIERALQRILREGHADQEAFTIFAIAQSDARFLFGTDVQNYIQRLRKRIAWLMSFPDRVIDQSEKRNELIDRQAKYLTDLSNFWDEGTPLFAPYLNLTQKSVSFWRPW